MQPIKCVIFDWDGTLMDSTPKIVQTMQHAAAVTGVDVPSDLAVKNIIGISLHRATEILFPQSSAEVIDNIVSAYKKAFVALDHTPSPLFNGASQMLNTLAPQLTLAVATGKSRVGLNRALQQTQLASLFSITRTACEAHSKPDPDMLLQITKSLNVLPQECLMVGDTVHDLSMAQAINMPRLGVSMGAHEPERLQQHQPLAIVDDLSEVLTWVEHINTQFKQDVV